MPGAPLSAPPLSIAAACQRSTLTVSGSPERDVCTCRDAVSTWLGSDRVQREVVARTAPEQDVGIAFELTLAQHCESELGQRRLVHATTRGKVADPDADVIDYLTHALAGW